jgi:tetratricopeptide (TPR) repeat protein
MKTKNILIKQLLLLSVLFLIASCNLFNPTGSRTPSKSDADALVLEGYLHYQNGRYEKAIKMFEQAIKADSTKSEAWLGLAKSTLYKYEMNPFDLIPYFKVEEGEIPFMDVPDDFVTRYYEGISKTLESINELVRRDTLTSLYNAYIKADNQNDSLTEFLANFEAKYGDQLDQFPLSDKKIIFPNFSIGFGILAMADILIDFKHATLGFSPEIFMNPETGEPEFDIDELYNNALEDTAVISTFNESLLNLNDNMGILASSILPSVLNWSNDSGSFLGDDSLEYVANIEDALNEQIDNLEAVSFYLIGDRMDNDGDGCVDEEILDGEDNDNDGLVDEDLRIVSLTRVSKDSTDEFFGHIDSIGVVFPSLDHDGDGIKNNIEESRYLITTIEERKSSEDYRLAFASSYTFMSSDLKLKQQVMNDIDINHIQYDLTWRQENVGGCWVNYDQNRFEEWFEGR